MQSSYDGHVDLTIEEGDAASDQLVDHISLKVYPEVRVQPTDNSIDLSTDKETVAREVKNPELRPYDSRPHEDKARRNIAYFLVSILAVVIVGEMLMFALIDSKNLSELKDFFSIIMGPLVALVSAATGFYFAGKK
ncbi:MAG: hypothetical protein ACTMIS_07300 [Pseudomonas putida]|uniref:hypothetical protein n=1 Tax=Pseudomonas putida TaxID=303 RepID=UPI0018D63F25|nr:hypothetical protein [Pseudomonas putida]MBH3347275.1 hypothetical protein [Pseudomonas putida]